MKKRSLKGTLFPAFMVGALCLGAAGEAAAGPRTGGGGGGGGQRAARPSGGSGGVAMRSPGVPRSGVAMRPSGLSTRGGTAVRPGSPPVNVRGRATYGYGGRHVHGGHVHGGWGWYGGYWPYYWPYYGAYYYPYSYPSYGYYGYPAPYGYSAPYSEVPPTYQYDPYVPDDSGEPSGGMPEGPPAFMETDVAPGGATVKLDGLDVGQAKDYDGRWDKLNVSPGRHVIEFEAQGYKTLHLDINVRPGGNYRFGYDLVEGEGFDPRSKVERRRGEPSKPKPDEYYEPPRPEPQTYAPPRNAAPPPSSQVYQAPRSLPPPQAQAYEDAPPPAAGVFDETPQSTPGAPQDGPRAVKDGGGSGFLKMRVSPGDATVYLDGKFLGRAEEISGLHGAVPVPAGEHRIEVVRPGYSTRVVRVRVGEGDSEDVKVDLQQEADL